MLKVRLCTDDLRRDQVADILQVMALCKNYRRWTVADLSRTLFPAIRNLTALVVYHEITPVGFLTWTHFADEELAEIRSTGVTPPLEKWDNGDNLWFVDFASPKVPAKYVIQAIARTGEFREKEAWSIRRNDDASIRKVNRWKR